MDADEIKRRLKERGLRQVDLARHLGMEENKLSKSLSGERRFRVEEMDKLRAYLGDPGTGGLAAIPIVGDVPGGNWREAVRKPIGALPRPDPSIPPRAFALRVAGDSMDKEVPDGGTVVVDPEDRDLFPDRFYVVMVDGEATFKQFKADPARFVPCSTNPAHSDIRIGSGQAFELLGRVIWKASRM
jgi:repressor LexA